MMFKTRRYITLSGAFLLASLSLVTPATADVVSCWADCGNCVGWGSYACNHGGCIATGETVYCHSGCCLAGLGGACISLLPGQAFFYTLFCGFLPTVNAPTVEEVAEKSERAACLDLGVMPEQRPGQVEWIAIRTHGRIGLKGREVEVAAASPGMLAALPEIDPAHLLSGVETLEKQQLERIDLEAAEALEGTLLIALYPPDSARPAKIEIEPLAGTELAVEASGHVLLRLLLADDGRILDRESVAWSDLRLAAALEPQLDGRIRAPEPTLKPSATLRTIQVLLLVNVVDGKVASAIANAYTTP